MASAMRGTGRPVLWVGRSCCSNKRWLRDVCLTGSVRYLPLDRGSHHGKFSIETDVEQQSRRPVRPPKALGVLKQVRCAASLCRPPRCYSFCSRYTSAFQPSRSLDLLSSTDARPDTSANASSVSRPARASVVGSPASSSCSCCPYGSPLLSFLRASRFCSSTQIASPCLRLSSRTAAFTLLAQVVAVTPQKAAGLHHVAKKHHPCSAAVAAGKGFSRRSVCNDRQSSLDKPDARSLLLGVQPESPTPTSHGSSSSAEYMEVVRPGSTARCSCHTAIATGAKRLSYSTAVLLGGGDVTYPPIRIIPAGAARCAPTPAAHSAVAAMTAETSIVVKFHKDDTASIGCWGVPVPATKDICSANRRRSYTMLKGMVTEAKSPVLVSHLHTSKPAGGECICIAGMRRKWCSKRSTAEKKNEEMFSAYRHTHERPTCSGRHVEMIASPVSDLSCSLRSLPIAAGMAPLPLKQGSFLLKEERHDSGTDKCEECPSAASQPARESQSPECATEGAETLLSGEKFICMHPPDEGSYAAVLQEKIKAQTAGWAADSGLVNCLTDFLLVFKTALDVPWAIALPLLGGAIRLATLPFAVSSERDIRLRAVYGEEMTALQTAAEKAKANGFGSPEFKKAQKVLKTFLKKHNLSLIPLSIFQVLLIGVVVSLTTPAIRNISGCSNEFPHFAMEHPAWVESLALPDPTPLTAFVGTYGMLSLILAGWLMSDKIAKRLPQQPSSSSPFLTRVLPGIIASCVTTYAGIYFPVGAMFMLLPAAGVQAVFTRLFRLRAVERTLNLMPDSVRPLHVVYSEALRCRAPNVFQMWQREQKAKNSVPREIQSQVLLLWRQKMQQVYWNSSRLTSHFGEIKGAKL